MKSWDDILSLILHETNLFVMGTIYFTFTFELSELKIYFYALFLLFSLISWINNFHKLNVNRLLTPPGTPQAAPLVSSENQVSAAPAKRTVVRSASTTRASRVSD